MQHEKQIRRAMDNIRDTGSCTKLSDKAEYYIEIAKAFAALSYQGVYIVDLDTNKFVFSSDYQLLRCGLSEEEMLGKGLEYFSFLIPNDEREMLKDIKTVITSSYAEIPSEYKKQLIIFLNFHIDVDKRSVMICHKLQLIDFDEEGKPRYLIGLVSPSVHRDEPVIMAGIAGTDYAFQYLSESMSWEPLTMVNLSNDERTMLRLSMQGYSLEEISTLMYKSVETIKFYRRQVFSKLNVGNISEAISYATHYCML